MRDEIAREDDRRRGETAVWAEGAAAPPAQAAVPPAQPTPPRLPTGQPQLDARTKGIVVGVLVALALLSHFVLAPLASSVETHAASIVALDAKKDTVMRLVEGSTASSAAISLLPGDAGTPIAEKLVDLSSDFLVVLAAIYLEKYLLTVMGFVSFGVLVPVCCALGVVVALLDVRRPLRQTIASLTAKLALFAIAAYLVVPASVFTSGMIERTYEASINETLATAEQTADDIEASADETADKAKEDAQDQGLLDVLQQIPQTITSGVESLTDEAQRSLNNFIEALAVMLVTSCVIPILVLVFFLWLMRTILGVNVSIPTELLMPRAIRRR